MPFDVLGRTRATLTRRTSLSAPPWGRQQCRFQGGECTYPGLKGFPGKLLNPSRAGDRPLQLLVLNEEFLVSAGHQLALITSLPFVHTARRSYRLDDPVKMTDDREPGGGLKNLFLTQ